jgi:hypothetical protein
MSRVIRQVLGESVWGGIAPRGSGCKKVLVSVRIHTDVQTLKAGKGWGRREVSSVSYLAYPV